MFITSVPAHSLANKKAAAEEPNVPQRGCSALLARRWTLRRRHCLTTPSGPYLASFVPVGVIVVLFSEIKWMVDSMELLEKS
jgi:hypothetical protein